jgi:hypothetical protein
MPCSSPLIYIALKTVKNCGCRMRGDGVVVDERVEVSHGFM